MKLDELIPSSKLDEEGRDLLAVSLILSFARDLSQLVASQKKMLQLDPQHRISSEDALKHPYFAPRKVTPEIPWSMIIAFAITIGSWCTPTARLSVSTLFIQLRWWNQFVQYHSLDAVKNLCRFVFVFFVKNGYSSNHFCEYAPNWPHIHFFCYCYRCFFEQLWGAI